jgi:hypothetical protein
VGVEPTSSCFAGSCRAVWLQRQFVNALARNRTWSSTFAGSRANPAHPEDISFILFSVPRRGVEPRLADSKSVVLIHHTRKAQIARSGIEPDLRTSEVLVRSGTLTGHRVQYLDLESNQDLNFRTVGHRRVAVVYGPLHYRDMEPTAGFAPASAGLQDRRLSIFEPRRQARARGFEPRPPVLEAGCSPRSTLV